MDYERSKVEIVNTLAGINGSMKEFAESIESKFINAFNSKAGKKYGLNPSQMRRYGSEASFKYGDYDSL